MRAGKTYFAIGVFFWTVGSVCVSPAFGAEQPAPASSISSGGMFEQAGPAEMSPAAATQPRDQAGGTQTSIEKTAAGGASTGPKPSLPEGQDVNVGSFGKIDLHVKDLKLTKVLQLLSIQAKKNIIASKNVAGAVSADLYNVDFYEALDAILHPNGYGYRKKGSFIYVYTASELKKIQQQNREKVHRIIELSYMNAADASGFVKPMLSPEGSISVSSQVDEGFKPSTSDGGANSFAHSDKLVVYDYAKNVEQIMKVIDELDTRPKQVLIEATVLQARLTENNAFGVDFSLFSDLSPDDLSSPLSAVDDMISGNVNQGSAIGSTPGNTGSGQSSVKVGTLGDDGAVFVKALDSVTDTTVLATPKVLVLNRQKADLQVGQNLGYLSSTTTETATTQTVEFLDVGTQLTLRPFISNDDYVRMELRPSVSTGDTNRVVDGKVIPTERTQELTTNVMVESGQTVVLGGLFKETTSVNRNQVPGLGDIPGLGLAFQGQNDTVSRSEVIFLIKPTIMKDKALAKAGEQMMRDVEDARLGARQGLLPWSRTKLTASHMKQAYQHKRAGEIKKALWDVNLALYLDPSMVDAIQLKEELTGKKMRFYDRSRLNDVIDEMVDMQLKEQGGSTGEPAPDTSADEPTPAPAGSIDEDADSMSESPDSSEPNAGAAGMNEDGDIEIESGADTDLESDSDADAQFESGAEAESDASTTDASTQPTESDNESMLRPDRGSQSQMESQPDGSNASARAKSGEPTGTPWSDPTVGGGSADQPTSIELIGGEALEPNAPAGANWDSTDQ